MGVRIGGGVSSWNMKKKSISVTIYSKYNVFAVAKSHHTYSCSHSIVNFASRELLEKVNIR